MIVYIERKISRSSEISSYKPKNVLVIIYINTESTLQTVSMQIGYSIS